jgi:hypothetical protein
VVAVFEVEAFTAVLPVEAFEVGVFAVVLTLLAFAAAFAAVASMVAVFEAAVLQVVGFEVAFVVLAFVAAAFVEASGGIGSAVEASTMGFSPLAIMGIRSFTIPIHTTDTIPMAIILTVTGTVTSLTMSLVATQGWDICSFYLG